MKRTLSLFLAAVIGASVSVGQTGEATPAATAPAAADVVVLPKLGMSVRNFVRVSSNQPGGPGERAGLQPGDILLGIGSEPIITAQTFVDKLRPLPAGSAVTLKVLRGSTQFPRTVSLDDWAPDTPTKPEERGRLGTRIETLLLAGKIDGNGPARRMGIDEGASVWLPNQADRSASAFAHAIAQIPPDAPIRILFSRKQTIAAGELHSDGSAGRVPVDECFAPVALATPLSTLVERTAADPSGAKTYLASGEHRVVALVEDTVSGAATPTLRFYAEGAFIQGLPLSVHRCSATAANAKLASRLAIYKRGDVLAFTARLESLKTELVDRSAQGVNALLDGTPDSSAKLVSIEMRWTITSIIPMP